MASNTRVDLGATASVLGGHEIESSSGDAGYHHASVWRFFFKKSAVCCLVTGNEIYSSFNQAALCSTVDNCFKMNAHLEEN